MTHDPDQLVELAIFPNEMVATLFLNRLKEEGIEGGVFGTASGGLGFISDTTFPHGGAQVRVRRGDLDEAKQILEAYRSEHLGDDAEGFEEPGD